MILTRFWESMIYFTQTVILMKILVEMKHGLGDCVAMIPALENIRLNYPQAYIAMIVNGHANQEIFEHCSAHINKYYYLSLKNRSKMDTLSTVFSLWREHFDIGLLATMTPAKKGIDLFKIIGVKHPFGEQYRGLKFIDLDNEKHFVDRNIDNIRPFCKEIKFTQPEIQIDESETERVEKKLGISGRKIILNIGGADKNYYKGTYVYTRNWKKEYMVKLADLLSNLDYEICLLGAKLEESLIPDYEDLLRKDNVINCVNKTTVTESMALIKGANVCIGVDTGMQHIADALGVPTVSIFGPTNPKTHGAYSDKAVFVQVPERLPCQYCFEKDIYYTCPDRRCLNEILPDQVFTSIKNVLNRK